MLLQLAPMIACLALLLVLSAPAAPADRARAELDALAVRIELLKSRRLAGQDVGRELDRLLVRAEELAAEIERREATAPPAGAPAEDLREQADALQDEADRLAAALAALDVRIGDLRRAAGPGAGGGITTGAAVAGAAPSAEAARIQELFQERARLAARLAAVRSAAAAVEAELQRGER